MICKVCGRAESHHGFGEFLTHVLGVVDDRDRVSEAFDGLLTYAEAGRKLDLTRERVRQLAEAGDLRTVPTPHGPLVVLDATASQVRTMTRKVREALVGFATYEDAAGVLGVTPNAVRHMARVGKLPSIKTPRGPMVRLP